MFPGERPGVCVGVSTWRPEAALWSHWGWGTRGLAVSGVLLKAAGPWTTAPGRRIMWTDSQPRRTEHCGEGSPQKPPERAPTPAKAIHRQSAAARGADVAGTVATLTALTDAGGGGPPSAPCLSHQAGPAEPELEGLTGVGQPQARRRSHQATRLPQLNRPHRGTVTGWAWFLGTALPLTAGPGWACAWPHSSGLCRLEALGSREASLSRGHSKEHQPSWPGAAGQPRGHLVLGVGSPDWKEGGLLSPHTPRGRQWK